VIYEEDMYGRVPPEEETVEAQRAFTEDFTGLADFQHEPQAWFD
jgi:hypothetical protein